MKKGVSDLEQQLNQLGRQTLANNQRDAARKLQEAAGSIRDQMLKEKIEYSKRGDGERLGVLEADRERDRIEPRLAEAEDRRRRQRGRTRPSRARA